MGVSGGRARFGIIDATAGRPRAIDRAITRAIAKAITRVITRVVAREITRVVARAITRVVARAITRAITRFVAGDIARTCKMHAMAFGQQGQLQAPTCTQGQLQGQLGEGTPALLR